MIEYGGHTYKVLDMHTHWSKLMSRILKPLLELLSTNEILDEVYGHWKEFGKKINVPEGVSRKTAVKADAYVYILNYYGIDRAVVLPVFGMDVKFLYDCGKVFPERIIPFGGVKPRDDPVKVRETLERFVGEGRKGIKLHAQYHDFNVKLHAEDVGRVLEFLEEHKMIALFHTGSHFNIDDLNELLKKYEDLKVVLGHMGLGSQVDQAIRCAIDHPNVYLETSGQPYHYLIEYAVNHPDIGIERVLYGSDLPTLDPTVEISKILELPLSEEEKELILYKNGAKLLGLD